MNYIVIQKFRDVEIISEYRKLIPAEHSDLLRYFVNLYSKDVENIKQMNLYCFYEIKMHTIIDNVENIRNIFGEEESFDKYGWSGCPYSELAKFFINYCQDKQI